MTEWTFRQIIIYYLEDLLKYKMQEYGNAATIVEIKDIIEKLKKD